jgi:hypothetical protein
MNRALPIGLIALFLSGCTVPPDRVPLQPLPENGLPVPYAQLLTRARAQAMAATEAYYINRWSDVEEAAKSLEQTARVLSKAVEVPPKTKDNLNELSGDLAAEAKKLKEVAAAKDIDATNEALKRINSKVRALRPSE